MAQVPPSSPPSLQLSRRRPSAPGSARGRREKGPRACGAGARGARVRGAGGDAPEVQESRGGAKGCESG